MNPKTRAYLKAKRQSELAWREWRTELDARRAHASYRLEQLKTKADRAAANAQRTERNWMAAGYPDCDPVEPESDREAFEVVLDVGMEHVDPELAERAGAHYVWIVKMLAEFSRLIEDIKTVTEEQRHPVQTAANKAVDWVAAYWGRSQA